MCKTAYSQYLGYLIVYMHSFYLNKLKNQSSPIPDVLHNAQDTSHSTRHSLYDEELIARESKYGEILNRFISFHHRPYLIYFSCL